MKLQRRIIIHTVIICASYYTIDSIADRLLFYRDMSFLQVFITSPPIEELYARMLGMAAVIVLAIITLGVLRLSGRLDEPGIQQDGPKRFFSSDPNLTASIAHQIKTPLNAIIGFSELLKDPGLSDESKKIYINHINNSGNYLLELTNNIIDITRLETHQLFINKTGCRLNRMMEEVRSDIDAYMKERGKHEVSLVMKTGFSDKDFTLLTDGDRLKQVLVNLLENAAGFTDEGSIEFGYRTTDEVFLEFYVKDTGSGFNMERLEMIMEHFNRVVDERMRPFDTAALRINIAKHLVRLLGGKLKAESVLWEGSAFTFTIPLNEVEVYNKEDVAMDEDEGVFIWKDKHILIAEDVESNYIYLKEILRPTKIQLEWARNGNEAVQYYKKNKNVDLVLMDILMPEMDGYEASKELKKMNPKLPIIAQTAYSLEEDEKQDMFKSFDKYLVKPIWSHDLLKAVSDYLNI